MTKYCFSSAMVFIVDEGYMTKFETGTITAVFWAVYAVMQLVGGAVADKWHPERLITVGMFGAGLANLGVYLWYDNYVLTIIIWSLNAALQFAVWPAMFKMISTMISPEYRSSGMVIITLSNPAGILASYFVAGLVSRWQHNFLVSAIGLLIIAVVYEIMMRSVSGYMVEDRTKPQVVRDADNNIVKADDSVPFVKLVTSSGLMFVLAICFMRTAMYQIQTLVPVMINESYSNADPNVATLLSLIVLFCGASGSLLGGAISKKAKNELLATVVLTGIMLPMSALTLLLGKISYWFIIAAVSVIILCASAVSFFVTTLVATRFNKFGKGATVAGWLNSLSCFGTVMANFTFTLIAEKLGWIFTLTVVFILILIMFILATVVTPIWKRFIKKL